MKQLLLAAGVLATSPVIAQTSSPAPVPRLYVGAHLSVRTSQPFNAYSSASTSLGPALTVGVHLRPRVALQLSSAYNWRHGTYHGSYSASGQVVVDDYNTHLHTFAIPLLVRATLTKSASNWHVDALGGPTLLVFVAHQDYVQTVQGQATRSGTDRSVDTQTLLTLGPSVRYTLTPRLEVVADALANLNLSGLAHGAPLSSQLSSHLLAGVFYRFGP